MSSGQIELQEVLTAPPHPHYKGSSAHAAGLYGGSLKWNGKPFTDVLRTRAETLHRKRVLAGHRSDLSAAISEIRVLDGFGRGVTIDDLSPQLDLIPTDDEGRTVGFIVNDRWPVRVYASQLNVDLFIFLGPAEQDTVLIYGWLPTSEIEEAPIIWFEKNGRRYSYAHEIDQPFLFNLPDAFNFRGCPHFDTYGGLWQPAHLAFACCGCGKLVYDSHARDQWPFVLRSSHRDQEKGVGAVS